MAEIGYGETTGFSVALNSAGIPRYKNGLEMVYALDFRGLPFKYVSGGAQATGRILAVDRDNHILIATGAGVPDDAQTNFAQGYFFDTAGGAGATMYINEGDATSADFNAVPTAALGVIEAAAVDISSTVGDIDLDSADDFNVSVADNTVILTTDDTSISTGNDMVLVAGVDMGLTATAGGITILADAGVSIDSTSAPVRIEQFYAYGDEAYSVIGDTLDGATTVPEHGLVEIHTDGTLRIGSAGSATIVGVNKSGAAVATAGAITIGVAGAMLCLADTPLAAGASVKAALGGRVITMITPNIAGATMKAGATGAAFTNQPANGGIEVISSDAADTTQTVTVYGTTVGAGDVVTKEVITLNGITEVASTEVHWVDILGVVLNASCAGTVTVREATGDLAITTITTGNLTSGVVAVPEATSYAHNVAPTLVCSDTSTASVGLLGNNSSRNAIYDSQALNGVTAVTMNSAFRWVSSILVGALAADRTVTLSLGAAESYHLRVGKVGPKAAAATDDEVIIII
jgi:hypothetical protein